MTTEGKQMSQQGHTPLPWVVRPAVKPHRGAIWSACKGFSPRPVASTFGQETAGEREANAALKLAGEA